MTNKNTPDGIASSVCSSKGNIRGLHIDYVNSFLFAGMKNGKLSIFDINKPGKEKFIKEISCIDTKKKIRLVQYNRKNHEVFIGDEKGQISVWNLRTGEVLSRLISRGFPSTRYYDHSDDVA